MEQVTEMELIQALTEAAESESGDGYLTSSELQERTGWGKDKIRKNLRILARANQLDSQRVRRISMLTGDSYVAPGYKFVEPDGDS